MDFSSIGKNIKKYRRERGMKQETLAERTGLTANYIGMLERSDKLPSLTTLIHIANELDVTADMLLCDVLNQRYVIRSSLVFDKINALSEQEQQRIYAVIDVLLEQAEK